MSQKEERTGVGAVYISRTVSSTFMAFMVDSCRFNWPVTDRFWYQQVSRRLHLTGPSLVGPWKWVAVHFLDDFWLVTST